MVHTPMAIILDTIDEIPMFSFVNYKNATTMWQHFTTIHEWNANENIHIMQRYYFEYKLEHDQDVQSSIEF
jgi:hypothetical protein